MAGASTMTESSPENSKANPMSRSSLVRALLAILIGFGSSLVTAGDPSPRLPREQLLVYRGQDGKPVPVRTLADWAKRRHEIVRGMESVMGKLPGDGKRCPLDVKIEE